MRGGEFSFIKKYKSFDGWTNKLFSSTWFRDSNVYDYKFSHTKIYFIDDGFCIGGWKELRKRIKEKYNFLVI
jgi:hypothetical protein